MLGHEVKTTTISRTDREPAGYTDGGHVFLTCSACGKQLVDIWVTRPDADFTWQVQATCCYCGDRSFTKEVKGGIHPAGIGVTNPDNPDDATIVTRIIRIETLPDVVVFHTHKEQ